MPRRFRRRPAARSLLLAGMLVVALLRLAVDPWHDEHATRRLSEGPCRVVRIVQPATLLVEQDSVSGAQIAELRLLGIGFANLTNPSAVADFIRRFLATGQARLQFDRRRIDRDQRCLAYLFVDGRMLNLELVRAGLARVESYPGDSSSIARQLNRAQAEARRQSRGLWCKAR